MYGDFTSANNELSTNLLDSLICFYRKLKEEEYLGFEKKISLEEVEKIFYPELEEEQ